MLPPTPGPRSWRTTSTMQLRPYAWPREDDLFQIRTIAEQLCQFLTPATEPRRICGKPLLCTMNELHFRVKAQHRWYQWQVQHETDSLRHGKARLKGSIKVLSREIGRMESDMSALKARMREMEVRLSCPICLENAKSIVLECGHAFCMPCLQRKAQYDTTSLLCSVCRQPGNDTGKRIYL